MNAQPNEPGDSGASRRGSTEIGEAPLFGTRESAAGLPYADATAGAAAPRGASAQPPPRGELATPGQRLLARIIDIVAVGILLVIVETPLWLVVLSRDANLRALVTHYSAGPASPEQAQAVQQALLPWASVSSIIVVVVWFLYEVPLMARCGQTLGKRALRIRATTNATGSGLGWRSATLRWLVLGLPSLFGVYGLSVQIVDTGWLLWDRRQCLHDKPARTVVIRAGSH